jgi:hypothetical protein
MNSIIELFDALIKPTIYAKGKEIFKIPEIMKKLLDMLSGSNPTISLLVVNYFSSVFEFIKVYSLEDIKENQDKLSTKKRLFYT